MLKQSHVAGVLEGTPGGAQMGLPQEGVPKGGMQSLSRAALYDSLFF